MIAWLRNTNRAPALLRLLTAIRCATVTVGELLGGTGSGPQRYA